MKRYLVELEAGEREALAAITRKGSHRSQEGGQRVGSAQLRRGEFNEQRMTGRAITEVLRISMRRVDRVKKRFVEDGLDAALGGPAGSSSEVPSQGGRRIRGAAGRAQLQRSARGACAVVTAPLGGSRCGARLYRERLARDGAAGVEKKRPQTVAARWLGDPAVAHADFAAGMERVLDVYRRPYDGELPGGLHGRDAAPADRPDAHARAAGALRR